MQHRNTQWSAVVARAHRGSVPRWVDTPVPNACVLCGSVSVRGVRLFRWVGSFGSWFVVRESKVQSPVTSSTSPSVLRSYRSDYAAMAAGTRG